MKWTALLLIICLFLTPPVGATELWVTTPYLTTPEKLRELSEIPREDLQEHSFVSLFDRLLGHPVSQNVLDEILDLDFRARQLSLQGKFQESLGLYNQLQEKLKKVPNVAGIQKILASTLIRKAELLEALKRPSTSVWRQAHSWAPNLKLGADLYSPHTIQKFKVLGLGTKLLNVEIKALLQSYVFIDGRKLKSLNQVFKTKLEPGFHQTASITPGGFWEFKNFEIKPGSPVMALEFSPKPAALGDCVNPQYGGPEFQSSNKILVSFNDGQCERIFNGKGWFSVQGHSIESSSQPMVIEALAPPISTPWYSKIVKSPWFWIGVGTVVVGGIVMYKQSQEQTTVVVPSQTMK